MPELLTRILVYLPVILLGVSAHEAAHAWAAWKLGDSTAKRAGRMSLLPFPHLDPLGSLLLPGILLALNAPFLVAYAKPAPVNVDKLRKPKRDFSLVALAGPGANLGLALVFTAVGAFLVPWLGVDFLPMRQLLGAGILANAFLAGFNLLPLPGFDGLKALYALLPDRWCWALQRSDRLFLPLLVLAAWLGAFDWALLPAQWAGKMLLGLSGVGQPQF